MFIEPVPEYAAACRKRYAGNSRIEVAAVAIGASVGELQISISGPFSTASEETRREDARLGDRGTGGGRISVPVTTLDAFLADHRIPPGFDLLGVDVEGYEAEVFAGFDLARWRPRMLIVELMDTHPSATAHLQDHARLGREISALGYTVAFKDVTNTVFVRD